MFENEKLRKNRIDWARKMAANHKWRWCTGTDREIILISSSCVVALGASSNRICCFFCCCFIFILLDYISRRHLSGQYRISIKWNPVIMTSEEHPTAGYSARLVAACMARKTIKI